MLARLPQLDTSLTETGHAERAADAGPRGSPPQMQLVGFGSPA